MPNPAPTAPPPHPDPPEPDPNEHREYGDDGSLVVEDGGFAIVGDWVIHAEISDAAFRVYSLLLRFGGSSGNRMPSRALLARRLHRSVDSIDRALRELVDHGFVRVEHRRDGKQHLSNRYHVRTTDPQAKPAHAGGRRSAAPPRFQERASSTIPRRGGGRSAATRGRRTAGRVAADLRPYRDVLTETPPPPAPSAEAPDRWRTAEEVLAPKLLAAYGIEDLEDVSRRCVAARQALGQPIGRWSPQCLAMAIRLAVTARGWPEAAAVPALLAIAADPQTRSPGRLAEAGPWWDQPAAVPSAHVEDVSDLEQRLDDVAGHRPALQAQARAELTAEGLPLTRATVVRRACDILDRQETA